MKWGEYAIYITGLGRMDASVPYYA